MSPPAFERTTFALRGGAFHALVGGARDARPLVFLHGFPDHPPTALPFLAELARTHRVIAPWLRGYAPSPVVGPFDVDQLARDVIQLAEFVGGPIDLVGHDWGAVITHDVCAHWPALIRRAVSMAVPHPRVFVRAMRHADQRRASRYMARFQLPLAVSSEDIDQLWRTWSPGFSLDDEQRHALHACLAESMPHPIEYYRAWIRPLGGAAKRYRRAMRPSAVPLLHLHGADDGCVLAAYADGSNVIPNVGHFLHVEAPIEIADRVARWLA